MSETIKCIADDIFCEYYGNCGECTCWKPKMNYADFAEYCREIDPFYLYMEAVEETEDGEEVEW